MNRTAYLAVAMLAAAFSWASAEEAPRMNSVYFHYAIYYAPTPSAAPLKTAKETLAKRPVIAFEQFDALEVEGDKLAVAFRELPAKEYAPPLPTYLEQKGFGLSPEQREGVQKGEKVLLLDFFLVKPAKFAYLEKANELAVEIAEATGGLLWDEDTREMFTPKSWRERRLPADRAFQILANTTLHIVELPNKNYRALTLGMRKMGLPDLEVTEFPQPFTKPVMALLKFLVEESSKAGPLKPKLSWTPLEMRQRLGLPGDRELPQILFSVTKPQEGDPRNDVLTLNPFDCPGATYQDKLGHLLTSYFMPNEALRAVYKEREELAKMSARAREALKAKQAAFAKGAPEGEQLMIKAFMEEEYVWVLVDKWVGETIEGRLMRAPDKAKGKKMGDAVQLNLEHAFDYAHKKADGTVEGNETTKFIRKVEEESAKKPDTAKNEAKAP